MKLALACFVQTIGFSVVKPEILEHLGKKKTEDIYLKMIENSRNILSQMNNFFDIFWAVSDEGSEKSIWKDFSAIKIGEVSFATKLINIYNKLLDDYDGVIIIWPDAPEISSDTILEAVHFIKEGSFVIGPAYNNNFYLFGGSEEISKDITSQIKADNNKILEELSEQLAKINNIYHLDPLAKIETIEDLGAI